MIFPSWSVRNWIYFNKCSFSCLNFSIFHPIDRIPHANAFKGPGCHAITTSVHRAGTYSKGHSPGQAELWEGPAGQPLAPPESVLQHVRRSLRERPMGTRLADVMASSGQSTTRCKPITRVAGAAAGRARATCPPSADAVAAARLVKRGSGCSSGFSRELMCLIGSYFKYESSLATSDAVSFSGHPLDHGPVLQGGKPRGRGQQL